ncbi:MAG: hypothetical protein J5J00_15545 [Deltaproteobacteria bacterium]|nr:hypothetical protein [Deltaproteobacteria bacterium]
MRQKLKTLATPLLCALLLTACAGPTPGPDKQFEGELGGALVGAGAGAVTGFQVAAASGPGAAVGAGVGAVAGGIQGFFKDQVEISLMSLARETDAERQRALAHEILNEHYKRRLELHPTRDIYPADIFFYSDQVKLRSCAWPLIQELAAMNKQRYPWSRFQIAVYTKAASSESEYARHLSTERAKILGNFLIRAGIEPRRIETKAMVVDSPVLIDPADYPSRYSQAIEFTPIDR